jgi:hypothetical protein
MTDICIPILHIGDQQIADVSVTIGGVEKKHNFRVEAFSWDNKHEDRIRTLKNNIENYDQDWELVQIYNPSAKAKFIHVLFRKINLQ